MVKKEDIMVTRERVLGSEDRPAVEARLVEHWMLDAAAAHELAYGLSPAGCGHIDELLMNIEGRAEAIQKRDENRQEVIRIFNGESDKQLIIIGPCSLDTEADYTELFDYIEELQAQNPDAIIGLRGNGAKPRSRGGFTGVYGSTMPGSRRTQLDIYDEAFQRGIPIFTEITDKDQFGMLAPYLTGAWLGARDMGSTELRLLFSATRLPVMVKNSIDGRISSLQDAIEAIGKNTEQNEYSGVNLGHIAYSCRHEDGGPTMLTVAEGNQNVAIVARGYDLEEEELIGDALVMVQNLSEHRREKKAVEHLSKVCVLAARLGRKAMLDGGHDVSEMFLIAKKEPRRFLKVLEKFRQAVERGEIRHPESMVGYLGEISVTTGRTDPNLVLTDETREEIAAEITASTQLLRARATPAAVKNFA